MLSLVESLESGLVDTRIGSQRDALKKLVDGLKELSTAQIQTQEGKRQSPSLISAFTFSLVAEFLNKNELIEL
ncbi:hypothetical protein FBUS_01889 [Fasciolopsis buskii]|uniref:Uncharacterized protein n=1 Tax=Fasciolopsis buskii TaxID=27845 RepID=A0A8E0S8I0_9TREM|nr:hypothetical protein FBUS_01889 [Fasciolopsis buski]